MSDYGERTNRCYRHPDRESFVRCQRCGRTICGECQTPAPVGVHCPECVKEARASAPKGAPLTTRAGRWLNPAGGRPVITYLLIVICIVVFAAQLLSTDQVTDAGDFAPSDVNFEPWRMVTAIFLHGSPLHLLLNMYALFIIGPTLEALIGRVRLLALFLIAGFGGSVGVLLLSNPLVPTVGASGAIFGMFGAFFVIQRKFGRSVGQIAAVIALNLVFSFIVPGIAWQAHVGGLVVGAAIAFIFLETRQRRQRALQVILVLALVAVLIAVTLVKASTLTP